MATSKKPGKKVSKKKTAVKKAKAPSKKKVQAKKKAPVKKVARVSKMAKAREVMARLKKSKKKKTRKEIIDALIKEVPLTQPRANSYYWFINNE